MRKVRSLLVFGCLIIMLISAKMQVRATVDSPADVAWEFAAFGSSTDKNHAAFSGSAAEGAVTINADSGKTVPGSTDGVVFYYTAVPADRNFTLRSKVTIHAWQLTNGQEGFGLMAADRVGVHGDGSTFWNNSYMASATSVKYYYDLDAKKVTNNTLAKSITMELGIGAQEKTGVTPDNLARLEAGDLETVTNEFSSKMYTMESSAGAAMANGSTVYTNLIANGTVTTATGDVPVAGTSPDAVTDLYFTIQKNNTGYFVSYEDMMGNVVTQKFYDADALEQLDQDYVYVGFFTANCVNATFSDISFRTIEPENDAPAEEQPIEKVPVAMSVISHSGQGSPDYEFAFVANCDGKLFIIDSAGTTVVSSVNVEANKRKDGLKVKLKKGSNKYTLIFTPDKDYVPGENREMESYATISMGKTITYKTYEGENGCLYVAPEASGQGTKADPMDIFTAVKYVAPGQTILLMEGTYKLTSSLNIEKGVNGTADNKMYMIADPAASSRPVLDFQKTGSGFRLKADYWVIRGFDVTGSTSGGVTIAGNYNTAERIDTYYNLNTGLSISRASSYDTVEDWPTYNYVLNCTSYGNADEGYEDADGFGSKLTCGVGNVFDGCIAHHNADDGWDLFAKVQYGNIGAVTIKNSVAYGNGYLEDGTDAGNGNGFKLGGDGLSGKHVLENCIAFDNKAKGIDSNSCPDVIVRDSISFNNGKANVALYPGSLATETDYDISGVISFRTKGLSTGENITLLGSQDNSKVYNETNYYWNKTTRQSVNTLGEAVSADWFVSLDTSVRPTRNVDGSINMHGLLQLTDKAPGQDGGGEEPDVSDGDVSDGDVSDGDVSDGDVSGGDVSDGDISDGDVSDGNPGGGGSAPEEKPTGLYVELANPDVEYVYTGSVLKPAIVVYNNGEELTAGVHYTVKYSNNTNASTAKKPAKITVTGKGNLTGSATTTFEIKRKNIGEEDVIAGDIVIAKNAVPTPVLVYNGKKLTTKDYSKSAGNVKYAADGLLLIEGKGNFTGEREIPVKVVEKKELKKFTVTVDTKTVLIYNGQEQIPTITVKDAKDKTKVLEAEKDYIIDFGSYSTVNAGTVKFTVIGRGEYTGTIAKSYKIKPLAVKEGISFDADSIDAAGYTFVSSGVKIDEDIVVKHGDTKLVPGKDYKVTYSNNKKVSTAKSWAKFTITFQGNYKGSKALKGTFKINPAPLSNDTEGIQIVAADKVYTKKNVYKSAPYVTINGVTLKSSNYKATYYTDAEMTREMTSKNKIDLGESETCATVYVKIVGKGNYAPVNGEYATATYQVVKKASEDIDLSKGRVTFVDAEGKNLGKLEYTGKELEPQVKVEIKAKVNGKTQWVEVDPANYKVSYVNNVNKGTATAVVTAIGDGYVGSKAANFKIVAKNLKSLSDLLKALFGFL